MEEKPKKCSCVHELGHECDARFCYCLKHWNKKNNLIEIKDIDQFVVRKTNPKKGLPNGAWVCFNHGKDKNNQSFAKTPQEALQSYINNFLLPK